MTEQQGNLWDYHISHGWLVVTCNGTIKTNGYAVLGRGIAAQTVARYPKLPRKLGEKLRADGNRVYYFPDWLILTMPVKHNWWEQADLNLINRSCHQLVEQANWHNMQDIYMPRPGCGNGGLRWEQVKPICATLLDDRFHVVQI